MRFLAALLGGIAVALTVAELSGHGLRRTTRTPRPRRGPTRQEWLVQAGATVTAAQLRAVTILSGLGVGAAALLVTHTFVVAVLPAVAVAAFPWTYFARQRALRARTRIAAWPDAIRAVLAALEANAGLHQALGHLSTTGPEALRPVFSRYAAVATAVDQKAALEVVRAEMADPVTDSIVEVLSQAMDRGPGVAISVLRDLAEDVAADLQTLERIDTLSLEQRLNARAAFVLPYAVLVLLCLRAGPYRDFYRSAAGLAVAILGGLLSTAGLSIVTRLARLPEPERLFTGTRRLGSIR